MLPIMPERASTNGAWVDAVFLVLHATTILFSLIVAVSVIYMVVKYRRGHKVDRSNPPLEHAFLELGWTIIPCIICLGIFGLSTFVYFGNTRVPDGAMEVQVVAKQWMWKLQQPNGRWEMNELHIPVNRPIKLTMISEDVIHDFYVPAFRTKMDVIPGRYTQEWFQPNKVGDYHLFCAEFCGTYHSGMTGWVHVMEPGAYERWLSQGTVKASVAAEGERLFRQYGCSGCHGLNSSVRAPLLNGIYGKPVAIEDPNTGKTRVITADQRYIHDSVLLPEQEIAAGYKPIMPSFRGRLSEADVLKLIDYIKSLSTTNGTSNGMIDPQRTGNVDVSDIRTRAGFVPSNMGNIQRNAARNSSSTGTYSAEQMAGGTGTSSPGNLNGAAQHWTNKPGAGMKSTNATNNPSNPVTNERMGR